MKKPQNEWLVLKHSIAQALGVNSSTVDEPNKEGFGDFSFPCFNIAKAENRNPKEIAEVSAGEMKALPEISEVKAMGPYVNFFVDWDRLGTRVLKNFHMNFGGGFEKGKFLIEHTSINPNSSPHVGRARNAIIADSLTQLLKFSGKKIETHYFVNDVGKQIALLVWAAQKKKGKLKFTDVLDLYIAANKEMESNKEIEKEIFELLAKFESGDKKTISHFKKIVKLCVEGQKKILKELVVEFDLFDFESAWLGKKTNDILKKLEKTGKLFTDKDNRKVVDLKGTEGLGESTFFVVTRADGTSLYSLRDLAYTSWKAEKAGSGLNILVLGEDQKLYFLQLSAVLKLLGIEPPKVLHYSFVLLGGAKMSTRQGNVVLLEDFMKEVYAKASEEIKKRWPELAEKEVKARARKIGNAAVRYGMLKVSPEKNVLFNLEEAVRFEGDTGPYLLYTYARANSILEKAGKWKDSEFFNFEKPEEIAVMKKICQFPSLVEKASVDLRPHLVAIFAGELADAFNKFYEACPVINAENDLQKISRLKLVWASRIVLRNCAKIIGIEVMEKM